MSKTIIIDEAGLPKALTVDALRTSKQGGGTEDWVFASETDSDFIKMSVGKNVEVNASDYGAQAITEVDVTQAIYDIETHEDKSPTEPQVVSIKEGNTPRYLSQVKKLRVRQQSDSMVSFIPNFTTGTLYATKRGHYVAKNDGYEGYSKVYVDVPESSDGAGEDGGWTDLPYSIRVTTPPRKIIYTHGDTIVYSGIIVHAYDSKGQDLGVVPFNQLIFPETTADVQKTDGWTDGQGLNAMMLYYTPHIDYMERQVFLSGEILGKDGNGYDATYGGGPATVLITRYDDTNYGMSMTSNDANCDMYADSIPPSPWSSIRGGWVKSGATGLKIHPGNFSHMSWSEYLTNVPVSAVDPRNVDPDNVYAIQHIPVQWHRYRDGLILETSFDIKVKGATP